MGNVAAIQFWLVGEIAVSAWCIRWKSAMFDVAVKYFAVVVCFLVYWFYAVLIRAEVVGSY